MKKLLLTLATIVSVASLANAGNGYCRLGKASLTPTGNGGIYTLNCGEEMVVCYETDDKGSTTPGSKIKINYEGVSLSATIMSSAPNNINQNTPKNIPTDLLPATAVVKLSNN